MRHIVKGGEPSALRTWKSNNAQSLQNLAYGNLPSDVKKQIKAALLTEQGLLCAYTMRRLASAADCHIEHVQPQNAAPGLDLDYVNMAACFPKDGGDTSHGYGAPIKAGATVTLGSDFVSPHQAGCDRRFGYTADGKISPAPEDQAAASTITFLGLDHEQLTELRRHAIEAHGLAVQRRTTRTARKLKSAAEARRFAAEVLRADTHGYLEPYCVVLAQVALDYANKEEARAKRMRSRPGTP